jgi:hypothetical protein
VQVTSLIIILVTVPVAFCMLTWVLATVYRLYFAERVESIPDIPIQFSRPLRSFDTVVAVGVREIKESQRKRLNSSHCRYTFSRGLSNGLPSDWLDDMWRRRN